MVGGPEVDASPKVAALLEAVTAAVDTLLDAPLPSLTSTELLELVQGWETHRRREVAVEHLLLSAVMGRGVAGEFGFASPQALLVGVLRVDPGEAKARVRAAQDLGPRTGLTGEQLEPVFGETAAAQKTGVISAGHAKVITTTLDGLSEDLDFAHGARVQAELVAQARWFTPRDLAKLATRIVAHLDPDGTEPSDTRQQQNRGFTLARRPDGMVIPTGALTPACGAALEAVLDCLSAPTPATPAPASDTDAGAGQTGTTGGAAGDSGGVGDGVVERDSRTPAQRRHDALLDSSLRLLADGGLPPSGGVPTTLLITMSDEQFRTQTGYATTSHGDLISIPEAMTVAEEADVVSVLLNPTGGVISHGRQRRLASPAQRLALYARDQGCCFPGCTIPVQWTQVHHQIPWHRGGKTSIHTMALLCGHHHRTFEQLGWTLTMTNGIPYWIPPPWIDPTQQPTRNTQHHPPPIPIDAAPIRADRDCDLGGDGPPPQQGSSP
ncbi:uncharacterized protein DUF222 [Jatrophihabitans sp. GAS493]|uniref:HNH endonuclease signature motif containing protein n=1 Tax=Jatrophihabitans sp. GAS493 TaxID=1907575 RepID=UPI000BB6BA72|nr:HNH endonuclease signature motif containing protein [Jatrophihabitans sp. GAS493]SOD74753.1 uncharacterized protein DUF222 [Jatrophihabitans sp. GAS493]